MKPIDFEDLYRDGRHYDCQTKDFVEDIPFYLRQIKKYGEPVLELACGTGRITIPVAEKGIKITGLDVLESMLSHAKRKAAEKEVDIEWIKADCRNFKLNKKFNLIFFPFNSFLHLHNLESYEACFSCVKDHLTDQGRFIIDIFNPNLDILRRDPSEKFPVSEYEDPDGKGTVKISEQTSYDTSTQLMHIKWHYKIGNQEFIKEWKNRILFPKEIDTLLIYNGFRIETKFGNYDETPFDSMSQKQLIVCHSK
ncbi:class I SAM-dependent methyltransferase [Thermococci archaeon]|nr:MAG: class I SAM-dependent methyltransferase [Thermococci archaeon]